MTLQGPSAGILGSRAAATWDQARLGRLGEDLAKAAVTAGCHPRAGHNRARWETVAWRDYRARVGVSGRSGPWRITVAQEMPGGVSQWVTQADGMPWEPGWYTVLEHDERGLVMSDVPGEIAGCLPFTDRAEAEARDLAGRDGAPGYRVLIGGLGLGVVPARLLLHAPVARIDVVEIDEHVISLVARDETAREEWAGDGRLHVHHADVLTWRPSHARGCALHPTCRLWAGCAWHAAWWDIWDVPVAENLPSMRRLHRRFGRRTGWQMSWERPECERRARAGRASTEALLGELAARAAGGDGAGSPRICAITGGGLS